MVFDPAVSTVYASSYEIEVKCAFEGVSDAQTIELDCGDGSTGSVTAQGQTDISTTCSYDGYGTYTPRCRVIGQPDANQCQKSLTLDKKG
jgi:hypothetical protein